MLHIWKSACFHKELDAFWHTALTWLRSSPECRSCCPSHQDLGRTPSPAPRSPSFLFKVNTHTLSHTHTLIPSGQNLLMPTLIFFVPLFSLSCILVFCSTYYAHNCGAPLPEWIDSQCSTSESVELKEAGLSQYGLCYYRPAVPEYCSWVNNGSLDESRRSCFPQLPKLPFSWVCDQTPTNQRV